MVGTPGHVGAGQEPLVIRRKRKIFSSLRAGLTMAWSGHRRAVSSGLARPQWMLGSRQLKAGYAIEADTALFEYARALAAARLQTLWSRPRANTNNPAHLFKFARRTFPSMRDSQARWIKNFSNMESILTLFSKTTPRYRVRFLCNFSVRRVTALREDKGDVR